MATSRFSTNGFSVNGHAEGWEELRVATVGTGDSPARGTTHAKPQASGAAGDGGNARVEGATEAEAPPKGAEGAASPRTLEDSRAGLRIVVN